MIIRDAFNDIYRSSEFHKSQGVAKSILLSRLKTLVEGICAEGYKAADYSGRGLHAAIGRTLSVRSARDALRLVRHHIRVTLMPIAVASTSAQTLGHADCLRVSVFAQKS